MIAEPVPVTAPVRGATPGSAEPRLDQGSTLRTQQTRGGIHGWKHRSLRDQRQGRKPREALLHLALRMEVQGLGSAGSRVLRDRRSEPRRCDQPDARGSRSGRVLRHRRHRRVDRQGPRPRREVRRQDGHPSSGLVRALRRYRGQQVLALPERSERHRGDRAADRARVEDARPPDTEPPKALVVPAASLARLDRHALASDTPAVTPTDEAAREVEESRESYREWLSGPESFLAAVSRHELPVGHSLRFGVKGDVELVEAGAAVTIAATDDGFRVDGFKRGPGIVRLGRYRLRLSHQNAPAVVIIDPDAKREPIAPRWFPYSPSLRFILALEPDREKIALESTRERDRTAERVGWFTFSLEGTECRVAATRLLEPGVPEDSLQIFFKHRTNGRESYHSR